MNPYYVQIRMDSSPDVWVLIAKHFNDDERLSLSLICKQIHASLIEGFGFSRNKMINDANIKTEIAISVPVLLNIAIKNPAVAWPVTEAERNAPWFQVVAFCKSDFGTIFAKMTLNTGPVNARTIPVPKIIV